MSATERSGLLVLVGGPAERGRQHGEALREGVQAAVGRFLDDAAARTRMPGPDYVAQFLGATSFHRAMSAHTPDLVTELADVDLAVTLGAPDGTPWIELELAR